MHMFMTRPELEQIEFTYLLFHMSDVLSTMMSFEGEDIPKIREAVEAADFQLKLAVRRRRSVISVFEENFSRDNATLRDLREKLLDKRARLLNAELYLDAIMRYVDLVDEVIQQWD
ncbi:hypothetical protein M6B38_226355 [Iris pallida]|uniref:Uncharacterized protein n=1 Tax=Iris pallida TaxID=29817 RepID=A0AAX6DU30_IRIPA|nr:hypothetical protein M6B38_226355 [Iris pallida]